MSSTYLWRGCEHDIYYILEYHFYKKEIDKEKENPFCMYLCFYMRMNPQRKVWRLHTKLLPLLPQGHEITVGEAGLL